MKTIVSKWKIWSVGVLAAVALTSVVSGTPNERIVVAGTAVEKTAASSDLDASSSERALPDNGPAFWVVSSRSISWAQLQDPAHAISRLQFFRVDSQGRTTSAEESELHEEVGSADNLCIVVHGNRMSFSDALRFMWGFYRITSKVDGPMILWSWPSQSMVRGIARDSRLKAARSVQEAALLATWLNQLRPKGRVVLVGYSFGAKTLLRAFAESRQAIRDGSSPIPRGDGESWVQTAQRIELLLIAPAADVSELNEAIQVGKQVQTPFRIELTLNNLDPALKWYRHLWTCRGPNAIGWIFPCVTSDASSVLRIIDVTREVGHTHQWQRYFQSRGVRAILENLQENIDSARLMQSQVNR
jgi:esterase/lipase superfamily enzyme